MGRFIISRTAAGERFLLQSTNGQVLAVSRIYATLDACKKGIASLILHAPIMPVRDLTVGQGGPNPKCEIVASGTGFAYRVKAANGKVVVFSGTYATKKACLRAIAMLRSGVEDYEILFERQAGLVPLVMKPPAGAKPKSQSEKIKNSTKKASNGVENASFDLPTLDEIEETAADPAPVDLPDEETALDMPQTVKTAGDGAQNADFAAKTPVGTGVPDCPPSPTHSVGGTMPSPKASTLVCSANATSPDAPKSPTRSVGNATPDAPPKPEVKTPRMVRLTPERPKAPSGAPKTPPKRKGIFDVFFKK